MVYPAGTSTPYPPFSSPTTGKISPMTRGGGWSLDTKISPTTGGPVIGLQNKISPAVQGKMTMTWENIAYDQGSMD